MQSISDIISTTLNEFIADVKYRHIQAGQRATGKSIASLEKTLEQKGVDYVGQVLGAAHIGTFETGRGPARKGTRGSAEQAEFVSGLAEWCKIRGFTSAGLSDEQYVRIANGLRWYLNKFGTRLYRNGGRKDIITPAMQTFADNLEKRLEQYYTEEIKNNFFNSNI